MDSYVDLFQRNGGSLVMLAKGNRSQAVTDACKEHGGFYLGSIGGPAARLAKDCITKVEVLEYPELGMEAVWKIEVVDFPAFIVVDDKGNDFFTEVSKPVALAALSAGRSRLRGRGGRLLGDGVAAAAVTADAPAGRDHPMARDHERQRVVAHRAADGARRGPPGQAGQLAVGHDLAPPDVVRERLEHGAAEAVDAVEVERRGRTRAAFPANQSSSWRAIAVGRADLAVGLVVAGQADLAHAAFGHDDRHVTERTRLTPELHGRDAQAPSLREDLPLMSVSSSWCGLGGGLRSRRDADRGSSSPCWQRGGLGCAPCSCAAGVGRACHRGR